MRFPLTYDGPDDKSKEFVEIVNAAFYTGFMLAKLNSREDLERIPSMVRIILMSLAKAKAEKYLEDFQP